MPNFGTLGVCVACLLALAWGLVTAVGLRLTLRVPRERR